MVIIMDKTIKISEEAHEMLMKLGAKGESFDMIIKKIIKERGEPNV